MKGAKSDSIWRGLVNLVADAIKSLFREETMPRDRKATARHYVSMPEFWLFRGKKATLSSLSFLLLLCSIVLFTLTGVGFLVVTSTAIGYEYGHASNPGRDNFWLSLAMISCCLGIHSWKYALRLLRRARKLRAVVPLTRHNTGNLPEYETLVRPSKEPSYQADVLLRAAQGGQGTPEEQLLRPVDK